MGRTTVRVRQPLRWGVLALGGAALALLLSGCASIGASTIGRDRLDYDHAVTESWKRQLLLNLVKLRYGDAPMFLDVASIINSYTLEGQATLGKNWIGNGGPESIAASVNGHYADKPTITYSPMIGERFVKSLMTPIPPGVVLSLIQAGWGADAVFRVMVSSVNGVQNRFGAAGARAGGADPGLRSGGLIRTVGWGSRGQSPERRRG